MKKGRIVLVVIVSALVFIIGLALILFFIRLFAERQLDDVSPGIPCSEDLLVKADAYYVIPKYDNRSILENKTWIDKIISMRKDLRLHGVNHAYNEFGKDRDAAYLEEGIKIFEQAFNQTPERFKPPQLNISEGNKKLIEESGLKRDGRLNQLLHKVYHCNDSDWISNRLVDWF